MLDQQLQGLSLIKVLKWKRQERHWSKLVVLNKQEQPKNKANRQQTCSVGTEQREGAVLDKSFLSRLGFVLQSWPAETSSGQSLVLPFSKHVKRTIHFSHYIPKHFHTRIYIEIKFSQVTKRHQSCVVPSWDDARCEKIIHFGMKIIIL